MNRKIFIPVIIAVVVLPMMAFAIFTMSDLSATDDGKILSVVQGTSGNFTSSEKAEMAELILLGEVKSVKQVEEKEHPTAQYNMVISYIEIEPTQILKGTPVLNNNGNVILRTPGGETENYVTETEDLVFSESDDVFLYLGVNNPGTYVPVSSDTMFVIRDGQAKDNLDSLTDLDELVQKHRDIIRELP